MIMRLSFAGNITKAEHKMAGDKPIVEVSICKKHKERDKDAFTWVRVNIWKPAEFQIPKLVNGAFIAGSGEFKLRSFVGKDGAKGVSAECSCTSFDIEVTDGMPRESSDKAAFNAERAAPIKPAMGGGASDQEPPFASLGWWG